MKKFMNTKAFDGRPCHGFRNAVERSTKAELREMAAAENAMLRHARIFNGAEPSHQNGKTLRHGWFTLKGGAK